MTIDKNDDIPPQDDALRAEIEFIKDDFKKHLKYSLAKYDLTATIHDRYLALAMTIRDRLVERWIRTSKIYHQTRTKRVYYLSMEYLIGRAMGNNVINLRLDDAVTEAMNELGLDWGELRDFEHDSGLGNGGLGRLAACFLDSLATLEYPGYGYGIRYDYGIFRQKIEDGWQVEVPDNWLRHGNPWEIERPEYQFEVHFGGRVEAHYGKHGTVTHKWVGYESVMGIPYDLPIAGYGNNTVNNLRLWTAKAIEDFNLEFFNNGDYIKAYENKMLSENITNVLYPSDEIQEGKTLRFKQHFFFASCSIQDIVRRFKGENEGFEKFPDKVAIQLNDTHPALAIPELMRIFVYDEGIAWDAAWDLCKRTFGYTNHTLMPEALEKWPVSLFEKLLPLHLHIIYEINHRYLEDLRKRFGFTDERLQRMSLIQEHPEKAVRMGYLSIIGSNKVNGVAALHSKLLKETLFKDFYEVEKEKFISITNGITPRRWLLKANPELASLVTDKLGDGWIRDLDQLKGFEAYADDPDIHKRLEDIKLVNKLRLAEVIRKECGVTVDPHSMFDVHVKRLHEYKRQLLNVLHILHRYFEIKAHPTTSYVPRTFIFAAKAAPGYRIAKVIIKLINDVARKVNNDPAVRDLIKVVFLPDYRVSLAEKIIPASELSEQISTAGTEASGTGNMKFALNGAMTIGTYDGANIEIREAVGDENFFLFGHRVEDLHKLREGGGYPWDFYERDADLRRLLNLLHSSFFNWENPELFHSLHDSLVVGGDRYYHLADFRSYIDCQAKVDEAYLDRPRWNRMSVINIANMGRFSSDRSIQEYVSNVWKIEPNHIELKGTGTGRGGKQGTICMDIRNLRMDD